MMGCCEICVYHAPDVSKEMLREVKCGDCGLALANHRLAAHKTLRPGEAFAVNPSQIVRWPVVSA